MKISTITISLLIGLMSFSCGKSVFSNQTLSIKDGGGVNNPTGTCTDGSATLASDSFERASILADQAEDGFEWRAVINDHGASSIGADNGRSTAAEIFEGTFLGAPVANGSSLLAFYGRQGSSVHRIHLISKVFDIGAAAKLALSFKYLMADVNDSSDVAEEYLRVAVCKDHRDNCGVGATLDPLKVEKGHWTTLFQQEPTHNDNGLNGRNHTTDDWNSGTVRINSSDYPEMDGLLVFRLSVQLRDGFKDNVKTKALVDGVLVDQVQLKSECGGTIPPIGV